ncbi:MAG: sulfite reductase (ferredoxin), partial [Marinoscillum sp.]
MSTITKEAKADIQELQRKIQDFKLGVIPEERFKAFRLARGVYGQRQQGVQMLRLKLPFGKITANQLERVADLAEQYTNSNLHLTTRQNIQLHYVKLEDSPKIWESLEEVGVTTKEACGNTVRNVTASPFAGIDPEEPFDVSPYAQGVFEYFLRNPICQEMGRKIKMAFSSSKADSAFTYIHDFGFIPKVENGER